MSVIAIDGVPITYNLIRAIKVLAPVINGNFHGLNFVPSSYNKKTIYIRLSEKLDPHKIVDIINSDLINNRKYTAFIPERLPQIDVATKMKHIPMKLRKSLKIAPDLTPSQILAHIHTDVMTEIQSKYIGLFKLSHANKMPDRPVLLDTISKVVLKRLREILQENSAIETCFELSKTYRKTYPHYSDFQLIQSNLNQILEAAGKPRQQLQESELTHFDIASYMKSNVTHKRMQEVSDSYSGQIAHKVLNHLNNLDTTPSNNSPAEKARVRVREHLKKMAPYMQSMISHCASKYFVPHRASCAIVRIYGEPYLPNKEVLAPWLRSFRGVPKRDQRMYNMSRVRVNYAKLEALLQADGMEIGTAKLVIRPFDLPQLNIPLSSAEFEVNEGEEPAHGNDMEVEPENAEDWGDEL